MYKESGKVGVFSIILAVVTSIIVSFNISYVYYSVLANVPALNLLFFLTFISSSVIGLAMIVIGRFFHFRNRKTIIILTILTSLLANYFHWSITIYYLYTREIPSLFDFFNNCIWIMTPFDLMSAISHMFKEGLWSFGGNINGVFLVILWLIEFSLFIIIPFQYIRRVVYPPYSETYRKWYKKNEFNHPYDYVGSVNCLIKELEVDPIETIQKRGSGTMLRSSKLIIYYLEKEEYAFITFKNMIEGKEEIIQTFPYLRIDKETANKLFDLMKEHK